MSLSTNSKINCHFLVCFYWLLFLFIKSIISLLLCMLGNFGLDTRHGEFYLLGCWLFLYSYKYSWCLFLDAATLLGNSFILFRLAFKALLDGTRAASSLGGIFPCCWFFYPMSHRIWGFLFRLVERGINSSHVWAISITPCNILPMKT